MPDIVGVQITLAAFIVYSCFCHLVATNRDTDFLLRWAILFKAAAAGLVMWAPILPMVHPARAYWEPWTTPLWVWIVFILSTTFVHATWARHWRRVVPFFKRSKA